MKRVLFLTASTPNDGSAAEKNTKIMLKDLTNSFKVDLIYFKYKKDEYYIPESVNINVLKIYKISILIKLVNILFYPFLHPYYSVRFNWAILIQIKKIINLNKYDVIIFDQSQVMVYARYLNKSVPKILLCADVIAQKVSRSSNKLILKFCLFTERYCLNIPNTTIFSFSQKDCALIYEFYGLTAFVCLDYIDEKIINSSPKKIEDYYVFFGHWGRADNLNGLIWFFNIVTPLIEDDIFIKIIGKSFPPSCLKNIKSNIHLEIMGFVDNPYPLISNCKAVISPLFSGAGIKVKVIESLACGTPIIGTEISFEGLSNDFSSFLILSNSKQEFLENLNRVDFSIEKRKEVKRKFIESYQKETIPNIILKNIL